MQLEAQPGFALWFTGLPASGKTVLARELRQLLATRDIHAVVLDSDELRAVLTPEPRYTAAERDWLYHVIAYLAAWLTRSGVNVLIAATANRRSYRDGARANIGRFVEVYVRCDPAVCRQRDPKGLYRRAAQGLATALPGASADYEPPLAPEIVVDSDQCTPVEAARFVLQHIDDVVGRPSALRAGDCYDDPTPDTP